MKNERGIDPIRMTICGVALNLGFQGLILFFSAKLNRQKVFRMCNLWNAGILTGTDWLKNSFINNNISDYWSNIVEIIKMF